MTDQPKWTINLIEPDETAYVLDLLLDRAEWLKSIGSDQWANFAESRDRLLRDITPDRTWLLRDYTSGDPLGTITFTDADRDFWTPTEIAVPALYLSKLATSTKPEAHGLGRVLLSFAVWWASSSCQYSEVRLDAWKTSTKLHRYYEREGFRHIRTVQVPGRRSGALFSRPVQPFPGGPGRQPRPPYLAVGGRPLAFGPRPHTYEEGEREHRGASQP